VEESINNMAKYAQANLLLVPLHDEDGQVIVRVSGNDPASIRQRLHSPPWAAGHALSHQGRTG